MIEIRIGPQRIKGAYAWRSFFDTSIYLTLNSDFPREPLNPLDFIVLSDDITEMSSNELLGLKEEQNYDSENQKYENIYE